MAKAFSFTLDMQQTMEKEKLLKKMTKKEDGILNSLNDLSHVGKEFFYCCVHLLYTSQENGQHDNVFQNILPTFLQLNESKKIEINRSHVLNILESFVTNGNCLVQNRENKQITVSYTHLTLPTTPYV